MGALDVGIFAGTIGVVMGLIEVIKLMAKKRNGNGDNGIHHLADIARDQLKTLHAIDKELAGIRHEIRTLWTAQTHMDRKIDALHRRFDSQKRPTVETQ